MAAKENLKREIGVRALTLSILNITVGTGIFVIPAILAESLGAAAILPYFICGVIIFLIALCFAEAGSRTTVSGGAYTYIEAAFGPFAGFIANNLFVFASAAVSDAAIANALADTLKYFFPALDHQVFRVLFFIVVFASLAWINIRSVKHGVRFIEYATYAKLVPLIILVFAGTGFMSAKNLHWTSAPGIRSVGTASLFLFYAFLGLETPVTNGGEIKNPKRTVPLAIFLGILCVLILYILIQEVTQGVLGAAIAAHKDAPLAAVSGIIFGKAGLVLMIVVVAISMLGSLGGEVLAMPRLLYAGARDGLMPKAFARVHRRFFTPHIAVGFYASLGLLLSIFGNFTQLAIITSAATLLIYLGVVLATIKLRRTASPEAEKTFRVPGGITIPLLAVCAILWLLSHLTKTEITGLVVFILIFSAVYWVSKISGKKTLVALD